MRTRTATAAALGAVVALAAGIGAGPSAAQEPQGADGVRVGVVAGYDSRYLVGRRLPVTVSIEADRLVRGAVEVAVDGLTGTWSTPVEVPGGSDKDVIVVIPTASAFPVDAVHVRLVGAGDVITAEAELEPLQADELVGLLPGVTPADLPAPIDYPMDVGTARFAALAPDLVAIPGAIDPIGTIVAGPEELGRLDAGARAVVLDWIDRGGRLVVDVGPGTAVAGLPDAWQPGPSGRAPAGLGEVRVSQGRAAAGAWGEVLEPTPTVSTAELTQFGFGNGVTVPLGDSLARDAGLDALDLPWLLGFLAVYVALVGPVAYLVLRRRPSLGWIAIPALAAVFTAGAWVIGSDLRSGTTAAHGTVLETSPAGTRATTVVGTVSRSGRDGGARFPAGWTASPVDNSQFGFDPSRAGTSEVAVTEGAGGSDARIPLAAGDFGVVRGSGPVAEATSGLVLEAASDGDEVRGTVTNTNDFTVERIGVFLGRSAERIGDLDPGESAEFSFGGSEFGIRDPFFPAEASVWPEEAGFSDTGVFQPGSVVNLALLSEALAPLGPNARPRGVVTAIGWTRGLASPVDVSGGEPTGRSAVISRAPVIAGATGLARGAAHRELLRGPDGVELPDDDDIDQPTRGLVWRFALPPGTPATPLQLAVPSYVPRIDVWDGTAWATVDRTPFNFNGDPFGLRTVELPAGGRLGDTVLLRGYVMTDFGPINGDGVDLFTGAGR